MIIKLNLKRIRKILIINDASYSLSKAESDDTPTDECIFKENDSSDIGGVSWSTQRTTTLDRLGATNAMKKKPDSVTAVQIIIEAFKLLIANETVLQ